VKVNTRCHGNLDSVADVRRPIFSRAINRPIYRPTKNRPTKHVTRALLLQWKHGGIREYDDDEESAAVSAVLLVVLRKRRRQWRRNIWCHRHIVDNETGSTYKRYYFVVLQFIDITTACI